MSNGTQKPEDLPGDGTPSEAADAAQEEAVTASSPESGGSTAADSGSESPADELTVEDILNAAPQAGEPDLSETPEPANETERSYLDDLLRLTAEYANYRKRTEANAVIEKNRATAAVVTLLVPVLDDLDRAEQHGDLEEGSAFATIAQKVRGTLERLGLSGFGEKGEPFDPQLHEAIAQVPVPGTEQPTVLDVIERGYRLGDVELRAARVAVAVATDG